MGTASEAEFLAVHRRLRELSATTSADQFHVHAPALLLGLIPAENVVLDLIGSQGEVKSRVVV